MRWTKMIGLLLAGAVIGGLLTGYAVFEYMTRLGIDWNQWATSGRDEAKASDAMMTLGALKRLRAGDVDGAGRGLEWKLNGHIYELAMMKRNGRDPKGDTSKTLAKIREYRQANPWDSGNKEVDKATSDVLSDVSSAPQKAH